MEKMEANLNSEREVQDFNELMMEFALGKYKKARNPGTSLQWDTGALC